MVVFSPRRTRRKGKNSKLTQSKSQESIKRYELDACFSPDKDYVDHEKKGPTGISKGRWVRESRIGEGSQGTVWKQRRKSGGLMTEQVRAVKRIEGAIGDSGLKSVNARRELDILMGVQNRFQDLFVRCHGWFQDEAKNFIYIAMDFHPLGDLRKYLDDECGAQGEDVSRKLARQLLRGLAVLHENNICHRDINPKNILIASKFPLRVKIADFGISKLTDTERGAYTAFGSPGYAAPEQLNPLSRCSTSVDMWSLGCVLFEFLTSEKPSFSETINIEWRAKALGVSDIARAFLRGLVVTLPSARMSAPVALQHHWILAIEAEERSLWYEDRRSILSPHWGELTAIAALRRG